MDRRQLLGSGAALAASLGLGGMTVAAAAAGAYGDIRGVLCRVADHWIGAHGDPGDNGWARATFFSGLTALYRLTGEERYLAYARGWAEKHAYGLKGGVGTRHADNQCAGQAYLDLYAVDRDPDQIEAIGESVRRMAAGGEQPGKDDDWWWDDALHMAMPPFARMGLLHDDAPYWDKLHRLYTHTARAEGGPGLLDPGSGLWFRDKRFLPGGIVSPAGRPVLWSRGNGWVAGGLVKTLKALPRTAAHVPEYRAALVRLLRAARAVQRADGFWNVSLADPDHFPGPETSGTAFLAYGTAYALRAGLVPVRDFEAVAARAWHGLVTAAVHPDGFLGYVQGAGDRPESGQPVGRGSTADFGVGAFLLAGVELALLARGGETRVTRVTP
ncbi:glycoside hydrolase family 88 protein [Streptomyces sp. NPDC050617]|uniref:glycoside hydrolase family 88 protein n=1 Tax=Streptomyces sp. NPDC050617 TaxID=3154628 RepID=UPI003442113E